MTLLVIVLGNVILWKANETQPLNSRLMCQIHKSLEKGIAVNTEATQNAVVVLWRERHNYWENVLGGNWISPGYLKGS